MDSSLEDVVGNLHLQAVKLRHVAAQGRDVPLLVLFKVDERVIVDLPGTDGVVHGGHDDAAHGVRHA